MLAPYFFEELYNKSYWGSWSKTEKPQFTYRK